MEQPTTPAPAAGAHAPVIGVAFPGDPLDRRTWSGTPSGVARGLEEAGAVVEAVRVAPPPRAELAVLATLAAARLHRSRSGGLKATLRTAKATAEISPEMGHVQTAVARRSMRRGRPVDGVVQIGTGYSLPRGTPFVTYEDITVPQAIRYPYPGWDRMPRRAVLARIDRQRRCYAEALACCVTTGWVAESLVEDYGIPRDRIHVVGVGRNHSPEPPADRDWSVPRFLIVARDWEGKNGPGVLRAFRRVRAEIPEARLDVVGNHPPLTGEPGVTGHGWLALNQPDDRARAAALYQQATCYVMPSHFEASAIVYTEAAAAGLPSIGTSVGGSYELIGDGGRIVDPSDDEALYAAMRELSEPDVARRLGALAQERAELFTWPRVAERLMRALRPAGVSAEGLAPFLDEG